MTTDVTGSTSAGSTTEALGSETTQAPSTGEPMPGAVCGDGVIEGDEACDDGNRNPGDACTNTCALAVCGDGVVGPGEACDDGDLDDTDDCKSNCAPKGCGDGFVQPGEDCDDSGESPTCDLDCTAAVCGDMHVNASAGEDCDDGAGTPECDADCTTATCGDGVVNALAGEGCDDGNVAAGDACSSECTPTKLIDMSLGYRHTCAVFEDGAVRCWGHNSDGQLGQGSVASLGDEPGELPVPAISVGEAVSRVGAGLWHVCTVLAGGDARCWGWNVSGQLGYGGTQPLGSMPGDLPPPDLNVGAKLQQIEAGDRHTCAVTTDETVRCWGHGQFGQHGYGHANVIYAPNLSDVPGITGVQTVGLGAFSSCVLQAGGAVRCWGDNTYGILGSEVAAAIGDGPGEMPPPAIELGASATQLAVGSSHACIVTPAAKVRCWGWGTYGQLGSGDTKNIGNGADQMPPKDVPLGGPVQQVVAGFQHTCALMVGGKVRCWGRGSFGALGYGDDLHIVTIDQFPPADVDLGGDAKRLWAHHGDHTCAQLVDDTVRCWGRNDFGQLGYGHINHIGDDETPAQAGPVPY